MPNLLRMYELPIRHMSMCSSLKSISTFPSLSRVIFGVVAVVRVVDFFPDLHPFVLEVRQRDVVHNRAFAGGGAVD